MFATGETVGMAEWIIGDTSLVLVFFAKEIITIFSVYQAIF